MHRVNLSLTRGLAERLRSLAESRDVAVSALVRDLTESAPLPLAPVRDHRIPVLLDDAHAAVLQQAVTSGRYRHPAEVLRELLERQLGVDGELPQELSCAQKVMLEAGCWGSGQPDENRIFCSDPGYQEIVRQLIKERCP